MVGTGQTGRVQPYIPGEWVDQPERSGRCQAPVDHCRQCGQQLVEAEPTECPQCEQSTLNVARWQCRQAAEVELVGLRSVPTPVCGQCASRYATPGSTTKALTPPTPRPRGFRGLVDRLAAVVDWPHHRHR